MKIGELTLLALHGGCGSRLTKLYSEALGCLDEYLHLPIRPNLADDRDLLGRFNSAALRYEPAEGGLVPHLIGATLDLRQGRGGIFVVCLDGVHRGRADDYLSGLLRILDLPAEERLLELFAAGLNRPGDPFASFRKLPISDNVRFVGTWNVSASASPVQSELQSKAHWVAFAGPDLCEGADAAYQDETCRIRPVPLCDYRAWRRLPLRDGTTREFLLQINDALRQARLGLSSSAMQRIQVYLACAEPFISADNALDCQLKQTVLPLLRPGGPEMTETAFSLARLITKDRFPRSAELLSRLAAAPHGTSIFDLI
jgi:hypothetical protein